MKTIQTYLKESTLKDKLQDEKEKVDNALAEINKSTKETRKLISKKKKIAAALALIGTGVAIYKYKYKGK
jgi:hypothetical protein